MKKNTNNTQEQQKQDILSSIQKLKNSKGFSAAVGVKGLTNYLPGTEAANFKADFDNFVSQNLLPILQSGVLKGAMSDNDIKFLKAAATSLNTNMSEAKFKQTLDEMEAKLTGLNANKTSISSDQKAAETYGYIVPEYNSNIPIPY